VAHEEIGREGEHMSINVVSNILGNLMSYASHQELLPKITRRTDYCKAHENAGQNPEKLLISVGEYAIEDVLHEKRNDTISGAEDDHAKERADEPSFMSLEIL
jgi:hypothetical protein